MGFPPYGHTLNRSQSRVLRTMLLLRKDTNYVLKKLRTAHQNSLRNQKSLLGETIWSNISWIIGFHQNLKNSRCTRVLGKSVHIGFSTKTANFRWIISTSIGFVDMSGVDIYVGRVLNCRGSVALRQSDLSSGYVNIKNHVWKPHGGRPRDFPLRAHLEPIPE